jgi:hypothetical protein
VIRFLTMGVLLLGPAAPVWAQQSPQTELAVSGFTSALGTAGVTEFDQGFIASATPMQYTVAITRNDAQRVATLLVRSATATFGSTPISRVQWRRNDTPVWTGLSTTDAVIDSRTIATNGTSFSNSVWFRCLLDWGTDTPGTRSASVVVTLQITRP